MDQPGIDIPPGHPYTAAAELAGRELTALREAIETGNAGRARVCARRAVGAFLQCIASHWRENPGAHAMANLQYVASDESLPVPVREAAGRLLAGPRDQGRGAELSADPLADALAILNYFVRSASF